jgi:hypothetical protein
MVMVANHEGTERGSGEAVPFFSLDVRLGWVVNATTIVLWRTGRCIKFLNLIAVSLIRYAAVTRLKY